MSTAGWTGWAAGLSVEAEKAGAGEGRLAGWGGATGATMATITRHNPILIDLLSWQTQALKLTEEHHLVVWSRKRRTREEFLAELVPSLARLGDTQVCVLQGRLIEDLYSFCTQLEKGMGIGRMKRVIDGPEGVLAALRTRTAQGHVIKRRFIVWQDADYLLKKDAALFGRLVDAIAGVAAEHEYTSEDLLVIQRGIFIGGSVLDVYAEDEQGQFRSWLSEDMAVGAAGEGVQLPLWNVITGVEAPSFVRYEIGTNEV